MLSALMELIYTHRHGILPQRCASTARGCCVSCNSADVCVLLYLFVLRVCVFQEEGVNLVIGDSSLCAVMPEVLVYTCCKGCEVRMRCLFFSRAGCVGPRLCGCHCSRLAVGSSGTCLGQRVWGERRLLWNQRGLVEWESPQPLQFFARVV